MSKSDTLPEIFVEEKEVTFAVDPAVAPAIREAFANPVQVVALDHMTHRLRKRSAGMSLYLYLESRQPAQSERLIFELGDSGAIHAVYSPKRWVEGEGKKYELARPVIWDLEQAARFLSSNSHLVDSCLVKAKQTLLYGKSGRYKARLDFMLPLHPADPQQTGDAFCNLEFETRGDGVSPATWSVAFLTAHRLPLDLPPIRQSKQERARFNSPLQPLADARGIEKYVRAALITASGALGNWPADSSGHGASR